MTCQAKESFSYSLHARPCLGNDVVGNILVTLWYWTPAHQDSRFALFSMKNWRSFIGEGPQSYQRVKENLLFLLTSPHRSTRPGSLANLRLRTEMSFRMSCYYTDFIAKFCYATLDRNSVNGEYSTTSPQHSEMDQCESSIGVLGA